MIRLPTTCAWLLALAVLAAPFASPNLAQSAGLLPNAGALDLQAALGQPPRLGSEAQAAEIAALKQRMAARTPKRIERAQADRKESLAAFVSSLGGRKVKKKNAPVASALIKDVVGEVEVALEPYKAKYARPRPFTVDSSITLCVKEPKSASFPSSHAAVGVVIGEVLAAAVPARAAELRARGLDYGESRLVCGAHFPSDVHAGQAAGKVIAKALLNSPAFKARLDAARPELASLLGG